MICEIDIMAYQSLKDKTVRGTFWSAADALLGHGVTFIVGIVLARILSPTEYGLIGICTIFTTVLTGIVDSGFSNSLIRKKDVTDREYNTMFITNMIMSFGLYAVLFVSAPYIAVFFDKSELSALVRAMGLLLVLQALSLVQYTKLTKRIDFKTKIDWHELHRLLKVSFPVNVNSSEGINEIQFGYMMRPTHRSRLYDSDRFEVCNQRYSALCDQHHGAAILNDCKYGISMNGNAMELTLLRAAASPEMRADNGEHTFTYAFTVWEGSFYESPVTEQAYALNVPVQVVHGSCPSFSAFRTDASPR